MTGRRRLAMNLAALGGLDHAGASRAAHGDLDGVLDAARIADELGVDLVVLPDHLALHESAHAERAGFPYPLAHDWPEPLTTLAAVATVTERCRLGTSVLVAPLRPPLLLAKQLATLDVLSHGRVEPSFGIGWQREEFAANGSAFEGRFAVLEEQIRVCRALWGEPPASSDGPLWPFAGLHAHPRPPQGARIPIHLGGRLTRTHARRIVRIADGWCPAPLPDDELRAGIRLLREVAAEAGREAASVEITANTPLLPLGVHAAEVGEPHPLAAAERAWEAGARTVLVQPRAFCRTLDDLATFLEPLLAARDAD